MNELQGGGACRPYFVNPLCGSSDPSIARGADGFYYSVRCSAHGLVVYRSAVLTDPGVPHPVFELPAEGPGSQVPWAPEIHFLRGKWYIYYAASDRHEGIDDWPRRRMFVVEADTPLGPYRNPTELRLDDCMSIDGSVVEFPDGRLLLVYMRNESPCKPQKGHPTAHHNKLWMAPLSDPMTVSGPPVQLTAPEYPWEGEICEGPFGFWHGDRLFLIYAANAAHLKDYCLGLLTCTDPDRALDPAVWIKSPEPVLRSGNGVFGPGHASVVKSPDGTEDWLAYGTKANEDESFPGGWARVMDLKKIEWNRDGTPCFGSMPRRSEKIPLPAGQDPCERDGTAVQTADASTLRTAFQGYLMYEGRVRPTAPDAPIRGLEIRKDLFPTKLLLRDAAWRDAILSATFTGSFDATQVGLAARVSCPSAGANRMDGYLLLAGKGAIRLLRCAGEEAVELDRFDLGSSRGCTACAAELPETFTLTLALSGAGLTALLDGRLLFAVSDSTYASGRVGLYTHADAVVTAFSVESHDAGGGTK